jgi:hypothetical protein
MKSIYKEIDKDFIKLFVNVGVSPQSSNCQPSFLQVDTQYVKAVDPELEGGETQYEINIAAGPGPTDIKTVDVDATNPSEELGNNQYEINKEFIHVVGGQRIELDLIKNELDELNTSILPSSDPVSEGGTTQYDINRDNKIKIDALAIPKTDDIATVNSSVEGGTTQENVNISNHDKIDENLHAIGINLTDIKDNGDAIGINIDDIETLGTALVSLKTNNVSAVDSASEGGLDQQLININTKIEIQSNKIEIDSLKPKFLEIEILGGGPQLIENTTGFPMVKVANNYTLVYPSGIKIIFQNEIDPNQNNLLDDRIIDVQISGVDGFFEKYIVEIYPNGLKLDETDNIPFFLDRPTDALPIENGSS